MQSQKLDDSVLVRNYIAGNERSLEILILRHKQRIFSFIYSKVQDRDVADDIFQDTFIKVINTLKMGKYNIVSDISILYFGINKTENSLFVTQD